MEEKLKVLDRLFVLRSYLMAVRKLPMLDKFTLVRGISTDSYFKDCLSVVEKMISDYSEALCLLSLDDLPGAHVR